MGSPWFLNSNENPEDGLSSVLDRHGTRLGDLVRNLRVKKESFRTYGAPTKWAQKRMLINGVKCKTPYEWPKKVVWWSRMIK